jgi:hypothetical protein
VGAWAGVGRVWGYLVVAEREESGHKERGVYLITNF